MVLSEIIRFVLPRSHGTGRKFHELRAQVAGTGTVKCQYFGYVLQNEGFPLPKREDLMCWYLEWPDPEKRQWSQEMKKSLFELTEDTPRTLICDFVETESGGVRRGLESGICQFAIIRLNTLAPRFNPDLEKSMHKTFTDCYLAEGFVDGGWAYASNTNDADGCPLESSSEDLTEADRRLAYYPLGWKSLEDHHRYSQTELFDEEIDKLKKYFAPGSGAWYVTLQKHE